MVQDFKLKDVVVAAEIFFKSGPFRLGYSYCKDSASRHSRRTRSTVSLSPHLPQVGGSLPLLGFLSSNGPDHRTPPAVQIPCCCSTSTRLAINCAATESSRASESRAPGPSNVIPCPNLEQRCPPSATSSWAITDHLKASTTCYHDSGHGGTSGMKDSQRIFFVVQR
ncbi:uncharacterized protein LOC142578426 [Dermacentor variabilis]|uniref:uncharacterized protein LOC142578426 n=1 Tax=Dermacentor variabilis TaxID=34621 RepID=UPI003F5BF36E